MIHSLFSDEECKQASASPEPATRPLKRKKQDGPGNTKKKARVEIPLPMAPPSLPPAYSPLPDDFSFSLTPMTHLASTVGHLSMNAPCSSALAAIAPFPGPVSAAATAKRASAAHTAAASLGDVDAPALQRLHVEASQTNPLLLQLYLEKRKRIAAPVFFMANNPAQQMDQKFVCQQLRQGFLDIPTLLADYESRLLVQSGPMPLPDGSFLQLPHCMFGNECFGTLEWTNIRGLTEAITLMQAMLPADFQALVQQRKQPSYKWPCVLCHRKMPTEAVQYFRHLDEVDKSRPPPVLQRSSRVFVTRENPDEIHQLWRNLENVQGGYFSERIFKANPSEGIFAPLVENNVAALVARKQTGTGRWVIDQSALVWKPPVIAQPRLGESMANF